jgi:hypothetical protein
MKSTVIAFIMFASSFIVNASERSPFTDIFFDQAPSVLVQVNDETYHLLSINGVRRAEIVSRCEAQFGSECECMLAERFTETMSAIGLNIGDTASLGLYYMATHQVFTLNNHPVTEENAEDLFINRTLRNESCY